MKKFKALFIFFALFVIAPITVLAQDCSVALQQAFNRAETVCANLDPNTICYGGGTVSAEFDTAEGEAAIIWEEGARAPLERLVSVTSSAFDGSHLGIVLISAQYNLPVSAGGAFITLMGDASISNNVARADAFLATSANVTVAQTADLLSFPAAFGAETSRVVGVAATGESYSADAISADGAFVRVAYQFQEIGDTKFRASAWLSLDSLATFDTAALAILTADSFAPLQNMDVTVGEGGVPCDGETNFFIIDAPTDVKTSFVMDENAITIASLITCSYSGLCVVVEGRLEVVLQDGTSLILQVGDTFSISRGVIRLLPASIGTRLLYLASFPRYSSYFTTFNIPDAPSGIGR